MLTPLLFSKLLVITAFSGRSLSNRWFAVSWTHRLTDFGLKHDCYLLVRKRPLRNAFPPEVASGFILSELFSPTLYLPSSDGERGTPRLLNHP